MHHNRVRINGSVPVDELGMRASFDFGRIGKHGNIVRTRMKPNRNRIMIQIDTLRVVIVLVNI